MDKLKMQSSNLVDANIEKIAELFPNCIPEAKDENSILRRLVDHVISTAKTGAKPPAGRWGNFHFDDVMDLFEYRPDSSIIHYIKTR